MERIAVFAGSFCPFTKGHEDIVRRAAAIFDKVVVAVGHNPRKRDVFSVEERVEWISGIYRGDTSVEVRAYEGLTVDFCKQVGARFLVRGVRNTDDMAMECEMALANRELCNDIETVVIFSDPEYHILSSSFVREIWSMGRDCSKYVSYKLPDPTS
ncbi:MAG: pantetheine-phosphate adenylyltransferase [Bacteroidales bacterium]|nr:pantetheine-phosphate adenylyltransferase [Bacteroidales bacterium]MDY6348527.1 pantetheine-phosphate adenylyltransferase [Bacteroidales bacterium]